MQPDHHHHRRRRAAVLAIAALAGGLAVAAPAAAAPPTVTNGSLEQVQQGVPTCFTRSGWGDGTATWALTTAAHTGQVAQSVTLAGRTMGDRKLLVAENATCAPAVAAGAAYRLTVWYRSTATANSLTVFRHSAAGWTYWGDLAALPAAAGWTEATAVTPPVPAGTDQISFGISLSGDGTLVTDDYALARVGAAPPPPQELTYNGGLENPGGAPDGWALNGWGDGTVTGAVVAGAHTGAKAYSVTLAGRTQGDRKLLPTEARSPAVQPGSSYRLSVWYKSTSDSNSLTVFAHTAGGWQYYTDLMALPAAAGWTQATVDTPPIEAGVDAIAWGVSLYGDGTLVTDDYSTVRIGDAPPPPTGGPAADGRWTVLQTELPVRAVHATLLRTGKVLLIAGSGNDPDDFRAGEFRASLWDPVANTFGQLAVPKDMFCSGHVTLADGRVLVQGGTRSYPTVAGAADYAGLKDSWIFDPATNAFTATTDANEGHWYPTLTQLGNGDVWMAGGLKEDTTGAVNTEIFSAAQGRWLPTNQIAQSWHFWGLYPHMFLLADGRLFYSGGHVFGNGTPGTGASFYDPATGAVADVPGLRQKDMRDQASSVLLPPAQDQRVLITGGGNINTNVPGIGLTDVVDLDQAAPSYQPGPDLPGAGKMYVNSVLLPDRTVLASNGARLNRDAGSNVLTAASYDPATNAWTPVAPDPIARNYHSSSVLLPDGRVAVLGSNPGDGSFELRVSVYEPPYLFKGQRPVISGVPAQAGYGQQVQFQVGLPAGSTVRWAQLLRPTSVTHQMDSNMRLVDLPVTVQNGTATVTVPANPNLLPPGPYMLTVTDSAGVPSESLWVMIR